ncbi:hypothetical protein RFI_15206, partial [Reticulomyxa filosa]
MKHLAKKKTNKTKSKVKNCRLIQQKVFLTSGTGKKRKEKDKKKKERNKNNKEIKMPVLELYKHTSFAKNFVSHYSINALSFWTSTYEFFFALTFVFIHRRAIQRFVLRGVCKRCEDHKDKCDHVYDVCPDQCNVCGDDLLPVYYYVLCSYLGILIFRMIVRSAVYIYHGNDYKSVWILLFAGISSSALAAMQMYVALLLMQSSGGVNALKRS